MKKKDKFMIQEMAVLRFADGTHTIKEIMEKTELDKEDILRVLEKFADKKKIDFKIEGEAKYVPILIKEIPEMATNLGIISRKELEITKYCTGNRLIQDIFQELKQTGMVETIEELKKMLDLMVRKKFIRMRFYVE